MSNNQIFLTIPCNWSGTSPTDNSPQPARVTVNRNQPVLQNMEDYYITCLRLSFNSFTVPAVIAPLVPGTNFSDNTCTWGFAMTYNGFTSGLVNVTWQPVNTWSPPPSGVVGKSLQSSNPYYWLSTFTPLCNMITATLGECYNLLNTASGNALSGIDPPLCQWDPIRQSMFIAAPDKTFADNPSYNFDGDYPILIYFNNEALCLFAQYDITTPNVSDTPTTLTHYFNLTRDNYNSVINFSDADDPPVYYVTLYPQYFNPSSICPIDSFQCNTSIPLVYELITPPNPNYGKYADQAMIGSPNTSVNPSSSILIDIQGDYGSLSAYQQNFIYNKTDSTRYLEICGYGALKSFDLWFTFTTYSGDVVPLYLIPSTNCNIKIGFIKKSFLNGSNLR